MGTNVVTYEKATLPAVGAQAKQAAMITVVDSDTYDLAISTAKVLKERRDVIEAKRAAYVKPLNDLKALIQADFTPVIADYDAAIDTIKGAANGYLREQKRLAAVAQAAADKAVADAKLAAEAEAKKLEKKAPEQAAAIRAVAAVAVAPVVVVEKKEGSHTRTTWKARLVDKVALVQHAARLEQGALVMLQFDQAAANLAAKALKGPSNIPGVEFYEDDSLVLK